MRDIRVSLTSNRDGDACIRVMERDGDKTVYSERELWFGTYEELARLVQAVKFTHTEAEWKQAEQALYETRKEGA